MKILFKMIIVMIFFGMSVACSSMNNNSNQLESNEQNQPPVDQTEKNSNKENNDKDAKQEPNGSNPEPESTDEVQDKEKDEIVLENEAFKIFEPSPDTEVKDRIVVRGLARVFEGTVQYEFEDGHFILDQGYTTASEGAPEWGEFNIIIELDDAIDGSYRIILYEKSAKDGSNIHELIIPVHVSK